MTQQNVGQVHWKFKLAAQKIVQTTFKEAKELFKANHEYFSELYRTMSRTDRQQLECFAFGTTNGVYGVQSLRYTSEAIASILKNCHLSLQEVAQFLNMLPLEQINIIEGILKVREERV